MHYWIIAVIAGIGAIGGFVNVFIGDSGLHLPKTENGVLQPGFLGFVLVGCLAAVGSWASLEAFTFVGPSAKALELTTGDIANALLIGFGGAKWFTSESAKRVYRKAAGIAADRNKNPDAAVKIATGTPMEALKEAVEMR